MKARFSYANTIFKCDLSKGIDLSVAHEKSLAWNSPDVRTEPVISGDWVGSVDQGAAVNFYNICFNPHGNGTHTEGPGHILPGKASVNAHVPKGIMLALLLSVFPEEKEKGMAICKESLEEIWPEGLHFTALILRSLPNDAHVKHQDRSNTNPPYISPDAMQFIVEKGIEHILFDQPSVDPEQDGGALLAHRIFWAVDTGIRAHCTITELIFVPDEVPDGFYALNIQTAPFENDALPSRPIIYPVEF